MKMRGPRLTETLNAFTDPSVQEAERARGSDGLQEGAFEFFGELLLEFSVELVEWLVSLVHACVEGLTWL
jgi:hypothetical protein